MNTLSGRRALTAVSADGSRIHVEVYGSEGGPAVVLAHGWTCSTRFWSEQTALLAADHRVIVYDQRGHGRTAFPGPAPCTADALADDLEAVLAATLAPGERAVVAGHSMGGMTILAAARRPVFREHAAAVLLCSTGSSGLVAESLVLPLRAGRVRTRLTRAVLRSRAPLGPVTPLFRRLVRHATMGPATAPERVERCARIVHACGRRARVAWSHVLDTLDLDAEVRELRVPTAVLVGTADRMTPPVHARALAAALPDCTGLTVLPGMGHMTPVEAPEAVTGVIRELVDAHLGVGDPVRGQAGEVAAAGVAGADAVGAEDVA
ncbi:alpha/beta fold hydrolase [Streptomyces liangshanensis]|uniref:Alpha/beta hydrolase n=1 Tax=Streptomyces liangshanensis TaxID=2717324 RepID=A0A6G9H1E2_9ACTN|nr:alpha/beta hydrolase [Streptomyces liangshanensis]QIQ04362.1 alpha/beta hydrolase [Streptomyces liangshanensis]